MEEIWQKQREKGVVVIGVNVGEDGRCGNPAKAKEFAQRHKITYLMLVDTEGKLSALYGIEGIPHNVIIDKDGKMQYVQGGFDHTGLLQKLGELTKR